MDEDNTIKIID